MRSIEEKDQHCKKKVWRLLCVVFPCFPCDSKLTLGVCACWFPCQPCNELAGWTPPLTQRLLGYTLATNPAQNFSQKKQNEINYDYS